MAYAFADCVLDLQRFTLERKGELVKLEPKVFDVLAYLVDQPDRVVPKNELLDTLWPGEAVSDSVLPRCIAAARRAVGDDRTNQSVIQTAHGRGYRFVAQLRESAAAITYASDMPDAASLADAPEAAASGSAETPSLLFGRSEAMATLRDGLGAAAAGRVRVSVVVGEPGIGKTRLCEELMAEAKRIGAKSLIGRCYEGEGAPAFWPWLQILRGALEEQPEDSLLAELGPGAADLAELMPELRERFPGLPSPQGLTGEQARFRLFDSVARFLERRSARTVLCIVIDDLHWADEASTLLFEFVATQLRDARVQLIGTYRDIDVRRDHPLAKLLGALARSAHCERIALRGLEMEAMAELMAEIMARPPSPELVKTVSELTEGNPFYIQELSQLLGEHRGEEALDTRHLALPQGVRDAIGRRLDNLSGECNEMLRAAAVVGREFGAPILEDLLAVSSDALLELIGEALSAGILVESETGLGRYAFRHALTRQTLYDELRAPQRVRLHKSVGEALERYFAARSEEHLAELAHHFYEAAPGGAAAKAVDYCARAAIRAGEQLAYEGSARHYSDALEALDLQIPPDELRRCELLLGRREAEFACGRRNDWLATCHEAATLARQLGRTDLLARAAIDMRDYGEMGAPEDRGIAALLEEACEATREAYPVLHSQILSRMVGLRPWSDRMAERRRLASEAYALAEAHDDPEALAAALGARFWASLGPDAIEERRRVVQLTAELAERTGDKRLLLISWECALGLALILGDRPGVERALDEQSRVADEVRQPLFQFASLTYRASDALNCGHYQEAAELFSAARERGTGVASFAEVIFLGQQYWLYWMSGDSEGVAAERDGLLSLAEELPAASKLIRIAATLGIASAQNTESVRAELDAVIGDGLSELERDEHWLIACGILTDSIRVVADHGLARELYDLLHPYRELMIVHDLLRTCAGSVASVLGELATTMGEPELAESHWRYALQKEEAAGLRPAVLSTKAALAQLRIERGQPGDLEQATLALDAVDAESAAIGTHHRLDRKRGEARAALATRLR